MLPEHSIIIMRKGWGGEEGEREERGRREEIGEGEKREGKGGRTE